jgi:tetratricopeptide (TPR) repeat protein
MLTGCVATAEARKYGRRVRAQDECKIVSSPTIADNDRAKRYYESAVIYYDTKDYPKAREEFQKAHDISKDPEFLVNLSAVAAKQKEYQAAIKYLEQYIDECPNAPDTFSARQRVDDLKIALAIQEGEKPRKKFHWPPTPALALMGAGLGAILIGAGLGGGALSDSARVGSLTNQNQVFNAELQQVASRGKALQGAAIFFDVVGGVALATGIIWTGVWYQRRDGLSLSLAPQPGGILALGRF